MCCQVYFWKQWHSTSWTFQKISLLESESGYKSSAHGSFCVTHGPIKGIWWNFLAKNMSDFTSTRTYLSRIIPSRESLDQRWWRGWEPWPVTLKCHKSNTACGDAELSVPPAQPAPTPDYHYYPNLPRLHPSQTPKLPCCALWTAATPPSGKKAVKPSKANRVQCLLHLFHNHMTNLDVCNASMKQTIPKTNYIVQTKKYLLNLLFTLIGKIFSGLYRTIFFQLKMFFTGVASFHAKSFFQLSSEIPLDLLAGPLEQFPPHALRQWLESLAKPSLQLFVPSMASKICLL